MDKLRKYFDFDGISTRSEYWGVYLVTIGLLFPIMFIVGLFSIMGGIIGMLVSTAISVFVLVAFTIVYAATSVRRCRDAGLSPWFALALIIPTVNFVCWIVFGCLPSAKQNNTHLY